MSTRPIEAPDIQQLVIRLGGGSITLEPNDFPGVVGRLKSKRADDFTIETFGTTLEIAAPRGRAGDADLRLALPEGIDLSCTVGSADLRSTVLLGTARTKSASGDIMIGQVGNVDAGTGSGDLIVDQVVGSSARLSTGSGDISVGACDAALRVRTGSGDISIGQLRAVMQGNTGSGGLNVAAATAGINVRTGSGDVSVGVADGLPTWLDLSSASGTVQVGLEQTSEPDPDTAHVTLQIRSGSGDIVIFRTSEDHHVSP